MVDGNATEAAVEYSDTCPKCGVGVGEPHLIHCTAARCLATGYQRFLCREHGGTSPECGYQTWDGYWPGDREAAGFGWWCVRNPDGPGYISVPPGTPGASPDLNRLYGSGEARWDRTAQRWVRADGGGQ